MANGAATRRWAEEQQLKLPPHANPVRVILPLSEWICDIRRCHCLSCYQSSIAASYPLLNSRGQSSSMQANAQKRGGGGKGLVCSEHWVLTIAHNRAITPAK